MALSAGCVSDQRLARSEEEVSALKTDLDHLTTMIANGNTRGTKSLFAIGFKNLSPEAKNRFHLQALTYEESVRAMAEADLAAGHFNVLDYGCIAMRLDARIQNGISEYLLKTYDVHEIYIGWGGRDPAVVGDMAKIYNAISIPAIEKKIGKSYKELYDEARKVVKAQKKS
jgi:hypothetical protein